MQPGTLMKQATREVPDWVSFRRKSYYPELQFEDRGVAESRPVSTRRFRDSAADWFYGRWDQTCSVI